MAWALLDIAPGVTLHSMIDNLHAADFLHALAPHISVDLPG